MNDLLEKMSKSAKELLSIIPPKFGFCAHISSTWAKYLQEEYSIHVEVVAGDLELANKLIFKCRENISIEKSKVWYGHCWIEVDNYIGDLSLFRTAYKELDFNKQLFLRKYISNNFGTNKGGFIAHRSELPNDMKYNKKFLVDEKIVEQLHYTTCHTVYNSST